MTYRFLTEADVVGLVDLGVAVAALESVLAEQGAERAFPVPKALGTWDPRSSMHSLGSASPEAGFAGFKSWVNTPSGASAIYALWDARDGRLAAVMEAASLGQLRTAAISGVATRWLAPAGADELAVCGSGRQALGQVAAVAAVRPVAHVRIYSPDAGRREAFRRRVEEATGLRATAYGSASEAVVDAPVVTLVTRATEPFVDAAMLAPGAHVNAVGAILPGNAELAGDVLAAADLIAVDDVDHARRASRELIEHFGDDDSTWKGVTRLADIVAAGSGRPAGARLTVFKGMGSGLSDLAVARVALARAEEHGRGIVMEQPAMRDIRLGPGVAS